MRLRSPRLRDGVGVRYFLIAVALALTACASPTVSTEKAGPVEDVRFASDLGPAVLDVTHYTPARQEDYRLLVEKCAHCHTLARVINAPITDAATWTRYVSRMHGRAQRRDGRPLVSAVEARRLVSFLAFDSRERKTRHAEAWAAFQADLQMKFEQERADRESQRRRASALSARESAPYVGDR